jgi:uncharacterized RDD family membrane protein YckC
MRKGNPGMADKRFGGFWRRFLAYGVDKVILYLISLVFFLIGLLAVGTGSDSFVNMIITGDLPDRMNLFGVLYLCTTFLIDALYSIWFHGTVGQTLGKMIFGLRVIPTSGGHMTFGIAFLRWVGCFVSGLVFCLGFLWISLDYRKQGWHDKIAATFVIRT